MPDPEKNPTKHAPETAKERPLWIAITGATIGGAIGCVTFLILLRQTGIYALVLPGTLIGLGRALGAKQFNLSLGIACALAALIVSIALEWQVAARPENQTLPNFILHLHERPLRNFGSIIAGTGLAAYFGVGRRGMN